MSSRPTLYPASAMAAVEPDSLLGLQQVLERADEQVLRRGEMLVRQGEPSDTLYFVLSGRFTVHVDSTAEPVAEIAQGQLVGEIGFFAGVRRTATVMALRDSRVLAITRKRFEEICECTPRIRDAVIMSLARRLAERHESLGTAVRTLAVIPAGGSRHCGRFLDLFRDAFDGTCTVFLTRSEMAAKFSDGFDNAAASGWLNALESGTDFIVYIMDETLTEWTEKCIRQADALLLVADETAPVELNPCERFAFAVHPVSARRLVILHRTRSDSASGTRSWLEQRDVLMHHHAALHDAADVRRLFRFVSGRALGFVAGGGGALGSAHLGVYKTFRGLGVDFDFLGGTSAGAAMMAAFACGADAERVDQGTHNIFVKARAFRRPTLPRYGLIDHKIFDRALRAEYGDLLIEDLWMPFFAVSTNLGAQKPKIHRRGPVWQAVRASGSIPGVLPPFFTSEGEMLADGALVDSVPLAPMKALKAGPNVVVSLGSDVPRTYAIDYDSIPGPRELVATALNPFSRRGLPQVPSVVQVIMLSMLANRRTDLPLSEADVLVRPELAHDLRFTSWERHSDIFRHSYHWCQAWIEARLADGDASLLALLGRR